MDYNTLNGAEEYYLPRDLIQEGEVHAEAGDAIMGVLPAYLDYDWKDDRFCCTYSLWGAKTQGEPYHMYLLAIACLIEERLGEKAFVYGDITFGQCRKAVEMANFYLKKSIRIPARCEVDRLYGRIQKLPLEEPEKIDVFEQLYLGVKDKSFYDFVKENFDAAAMQERWKKIFAESKIGTRGFAKDLKEYLSSGLGLEELCGIVRLEEEGNFQYEEFIKAVMDSKLHWKEKNTEDCLDVHPETEQPYSIWTLFADFTFGSAHNVKVDRYIPMEEIRAALKKGMGAKYNVDKYIDQYLEEENAAPEIDVSKENLSEEELEKMADTDASEVFQQLMDKVAGELQKKHEQYEISGYEDLMQYKKGSTVEPQLMEVIGKSFQFYHTMLEEERYKSLMEGSHEERAAYLIEQNHYLMLRDTDWMHIFSSIESDSSIYGRYYPMVRVKCDSVALGQMVRAFVMNDEFYVYAGELGEKYENV